MSNAAVPIFVISLGDAVDRRAAIAQKMQELGFDFTFVDAVDGRQMKVIEQPGYDAPARLRYFGVHLKGGEWGCLLSHKNIYDRMVKDNIPAAVIFEDDVIIADNFPGVLHDILNMDLDYDVVRFMGSNKIARKGYRHIAQVDGGLWLGRLPSIHGGAHAYLMSLRGAKKMVNYFARHKIAVPIDTLLGRCWETGLNVYAVNPVVRQDVVSFTSAIGEARFDKRSDLKPAQRLTFPFTRGWFKLCEHVGKRWIYLGYFWHDCRLKKMHRV
jgi:glycosyl transferase family 25